MLIKIRNNTVKYLETYSKKWNRPLSNPVLRIQSDDNRYCVGIPMSFMYVNKERKQDCLFVLLSKDTDRYNVWIRETNSIKPLTGRQFAALFDFDIIETQPKTEIVKETPKKDDLLDTKDKQLIELLSERDL